MWSYYFDKRHSHLYYDDNDDNDDGVSQYIIPIDVTPTEMVTVLTDVHPQNAYGLIKVTDVGILIDINDVHPQNAPQPR